MGFEHFQVVLSGGQAKYHEVDETVKKLPHIKPDQDPVPLRGSTFYVIHNGQHAIELELMDEPVRLSCRFTLCHPASVDLVFLGLLRELIGRLGMAAMICDDVTPAHSRSFSLGEFPDFLAITRDYIDARRAEWIAAFGNESLAATTNEVYERAILPRCQSGVEQPT